ncbi:hypothetical protein F5X68DRAFT_15616 [Plectosphaerella plurivora]|uniref:Uncharacterized protein n=1 Tax=Plectosphaerella plurivora TaxID=936078 RepID=A0A9P8VAX0_9PEZI|nr:hypothetical protein F5X68DRAFT_15616 [Plectosphaerella plurivora]
MVHLIRPFALGSRCFGCLTPIVQLGPGAGCHFSAGSDEPTDTRHRLSTSAPRGEVLVGRWVKHRREKGFRSVHTPMLWPCHHGNAGRLEGLSDLLASKPTEYARRRGQRWHEPHAKGRSRRSRRRPDEAKAGTAGRKVHCVAGRSRPYCSGKKGRTLSSACSGALAQSVVYLANPAANVY